MTSLSAAFSVNLDVLLVRAFAEPRSNGDDALGGILLIYPNKHKLKTLSLSLSLDLVRPQLQHVS